MGWHPPQATREDARPAQGHVHPQAQPNDTPADPSQMEGAMHPTSQAIWNAFAIRNPIYLEHQSPTTASSESSEMTPRAKASLMKASDLMEYLQWLIPEYSGDAAKELISANTWTNNLDKICTQYKTMYATEFFQSLIMSRLTGVVVDEMLDAGCNIPEAMLQQLRDKFQAPQFQYELILHIESGTVFKQCMRLNILNRLQKLAGELANHIALNTNPQLKPQILGNVKGSEKVKDAGSSKIKEKTDGTPNEVSVGKQAVEAVEDPGAEVSLITLKTAQHLGLKVDTSRRPWLKPIWSGANYKAFGRAKALVDIADGP
ncbi:hypothetical protein COEREDRAFT_10968 [Coemansia reversa NRRL 1564]|uniref:Uncharacterized protein n=1 Tax=Coemansia reversa (strain ATCC 12441 / NRRL 1564) TaxID=763665 RepID=A0A2G5B475_COERN|nr:hypothetical protein COEREDRAFT_10968 [Coemansia reversa NRRL 1564]|eukprot:PIA13808.1 hypothetical protein COEREDRAFT_10968 [Coemansia reversa NRRL 1564]